MYGIIYDADSEALAAAGVSAEQLAERVRDALAPAGFRPLRSDVLLCAEPRASELLVVHDAITALGRDPLCASTIARVAAFELVSWGDITAAVREGGRKGSASMPRARVEDIARRQAVVSLLLEREG